MVEWWVVLLAFAIVARVTRFLNADVLAAPLRSWVMRRWGEDSHPYVLITCPWCLSIWVAIPVVPLALLWGQTWVFLTVGLICGLSYAYAVVAQNLDGD